MPGDGWRKRSWWTDCGPGAMHRDHSIDRQLSGQLASIRAKTPSVSAPSAATQSIIAAQNDPAPTSAGIVSDASKRKTSAPSRMAASSALGYVSYQARGAVRLGDARAPAA